MSELPLVSFIRYRKRLHDADILTFEAYTREAQEKLEKLLLPSYDSLMLEKAYRSSSKILFKPEGVQIAHKYNKLYFYTKSGTLAVDLSDEILDFVTEAQNQQIYLKARLTRKVPVSNTTAVYFAEIEAIYTATYDFDRAKELLNEFPAIDLLMYSVGYKPEPEAVALKLAMFLPIYKPYNRPIHTVHFTPPRIGKSKTASILRGLTDAYHTVLPSPAKLIYDGRSGKYGLCYFYSTLYIDEFDKISGKRKDIFRETYEILLTGMSDGLWLRDISSKAQDYINVVGFCFMGNTGIEMQFGTDLAAYSTDSREKLRQLIYAYDVEAAPFLERIAYCEFLNEAKQAYKFLNRNEKKLVSYLDPRVARAVIKLTQERAHDVEPIVEPQDELEQHMNTVNAALAAMDIELDSDTITKLVKGELTFSDIAAYLKTQAEPVKAEEQRDDSLIDEVLSHEPA